MTKSPKIAGRHVRMVSIVLAAAIVIAGLCYSSWVLEFVLRIRVDAVNSFLSELDEVGRPHRAVFATGDKIVGALLIPAGSAGLVLFPRRRWSTVGWIALLCFGASTIADAMLPLHDCVPTPTTSCGGPSALFPQLHQPHALSSSLAVLSFAVTAVAFSVASFRYRRWRTLREFGLAVLVIGAVATAWMMIADNLSGHYALGIAQRIQVGAMSVWLIALATAVVLEGRRPAAASRAPIER